MAPRTRSRSQSRGQSRVYPFGLGVSQWYIAGRTRARRGWGRRHATKDEASWRQVRTPSESSCDSCSFPPTDLISCDSPPDLIGISTYFRRRAPPFSIIPWELSSFCYRRFRCGRGVVEPKEQLRRTTCSQAARTMSFAHELPPPVAHSSRSVTFDVLHLREIKQAQNVMTGGSGGFLQLSSRT